MKGFDAMIEEAAKCSDVDPLLAIAISRHETGHYTSDAFTQYNNFGGMTDSSGLMQFSSKEEGVDKFIKMLQWYFDDGLKSIEEIQPRYCPPEGDQWIASVSTIYKELQNAEF